MPEENDLPIKHKAYGRVVRPMARFAMSIMFVAAMVKLGLLISGTTLETSAILLLRCCFLAVCIGAVFTSAASWYKSAGLSFQRRLRMLYPFLVCVITLLLIHLGIRWHASGGFAALGSLFAAIAAVEFLSGVFFAPTLVRLFKALDVPLDREGELES